MHLTAHFQGEITIDGDFAGGMSVMTTSNPEGQRFDSLGGFSGGFLPQMRKFLTAIYEGKKSTESCYQALGDVLVAQAVYKSVRTRKWESATLDNLLET